MKLLLTMATAAVVAFAGAASSATVTIDSITGTWGNVQGGGSTVNGEGTSSIRWGQPATVNGQSGYDFVAANTPQVNPLSTFDVGEFTHLNWPIFAPSISGADLTVTVDGDVDGSVFSIGGTYSFSHFETPNGAAACGAGGGNPCADLVTLLGGVSTSAAVNIDGNEYFFNLLGFADLGAGSSMFLTQEGQTNSAGGLRGAFSITPDEMMPIPLPASMWLMLGGVGVLGAVKRKQRKVA